MATNKRKTRIRVALALTALAVASPIIARIGVWASARGRIYTSVSKTPHCRVALVLGAKVHKNGNPSTLLADRLNAAIKLYKAGKVEKLLMSGDNRFTHYNEPLKMRDYAVSKGVPIDDIVMDFAGRRTYDSMYRAKHIFDLDKVLVVSQKLHVERALFLSRSIGIDACGYASDVDRHDNFHLRIREFPASLSAVLDVYVLHPKPVLGKKEKV